MLSTTDHSRDSAGLTYVYPVLSRRAGGLSIGINLNPNHACNWRCIYCQVPDLVRGAAPEIDMKRFENELRGFIHDVKNGTFFQRNRIEPAMRTIRDIAFSGNGESTSAQNFDEIIRLTGQIIEETQLKNQTKLVLITNGSYIQRSQVQKGLQRMAGLNGEVWFKLDSATETGMKRINSIHRSLQSISVNLDRTCRLCPTWLQTCVFKQHGFEPSQEEQTAYLNFIKKLLTDRTPLKGVFLYGLARPSLQPEASQLTRLETHWLEDFAARIEALSLPVKISV